MSNNVPEMPADTDTFELLQLFVKLAGIETVWSLTCLFASADEGEEVVINGEIRTKEGV